MTRCLVGLDLGTSACKALAIDGEGRVLARAAAGYPMATPRPGWAEQAPADWWDGADRAMQSVVRALPAGCEVAAIGLSGQMHGLVALDDAGRVLRPAMLWCDNRTGPQCDRITERVGGLDALLGLTRNRMLPGFTGGKLLWMQQHEPALFEAMRRFLLPKDYLRLLMTGEHATDVSDASGTGLFDVAARCWSQPMLGVVGLLASQVPHALESHEISGRLRADIAERWGLPAGVPVVAGGGDSVIQTTSMGVIASGTVGVTIGTAGLVGAAAPHCPENQGGLLQVSCGNAPGLWHVMGVTLNGGGAFAWLRDALRPLPDAAAGFDELIRLAEAIEPGAGGLLFLPSLLGERCPVVAPEARGAWVGLTQGHDVRHMTRAVLEGVLLNLRSILELVRRSGSAFDTVRASGGAVVSPAWLQLLADVTGHAVSTVTGAAEGGAYCAALLAGIGAGHWRDLHEAVGVIEECETVPPRPDAARTYDRLHPIFATLHERLHRSMQDLATLKAGARA
ncbi:xylulokinase [Lichenicoccus sp.]|uniref:xylulokinase n=1 Tax=Lichenicoccus sp. TaxID=2781899 RepID=UPI003D11D51C